MIRSIRYFIILAFTLVFSPSAVPDTETSGQASRVIETLNSTLLDVMQNAAALGYQGRYEKLAPVIDATHDLKYIAQFSIGKRNWNSLSEDQINAFVERFKKYSIATYANRFNGYSGENFRVTGEQPAKRGQTEVTSLLEIPGEETIDFLYLMRPVDGTPKIVNIIVQGVSDLALKRAEFMSLLNEKGFEALLAHLDEKTTEYASEEK